MFLISSLKFSLKSLSILINQCFELYIWQIACLHFVQFFLWSFVLFFLLGYVTLFPHFDCLPMFVLSRAAMSSILIEWTYVVGVLWGPVVQYPWSAEPGATSVSVPCVGCCKVEPWLLLACQWGGLTFRLIGCKDWPWLQWRSCCAEADTMEQDSF